jgi:hypothetical protein
MEENITVATALNDLQLFIDQIQEVQQTLFEDRSSYIKSHPNLSRDDIRIVGYNQLINQIDLLIFRVKIVILGINSGEFQSILIGSNEGDLNLFTDVFTAWDYQIRIDYILHLYSYLEFYFKTIYSVMKEEDYICFSFNKAVNGLFDQTSIKECTRLKDTLKYFILLRHGHIHSMGKFIPDKDPLREYNFGTDHFSFQIGDPLPLSWEHAITLLKDLVDAWKYVINLDKVKRMDYIDPKSLEKRYVDKQKTGAP